MHCSTIENQLRIAVAAVACLLSACASDTNSFELRGWSDEQVKSIERAGTILCTEAGRCPTFAGGESYVEAIVEIQAIAAPDDEHEMVGTCRRMSDGTSRIAIRRDQTGDLLTYAALHELGHHYGCHDSDDPQDLMYSGLGEAVIEPKLTLSQADIDCVR
jgi:hypothetical protein